MIVVLFILLVAVLTAGLFREILIDHERKLIRLSENATKKQRLRLIKKAYFDDTKKQIRKTLNK